MKPGLQFASQSSSDTKSALERRRGTCSSPNDSASLSLHGHVEVVLAPGVVQGQGPKERLHGTHL
eukprot:CAMPEP_0184749360 /NCGR_PEP_ID=MMETSP0315-20130426/27516_1 /TAXON_ID=101924 /ORGANISM="Rhodosorus marinus, Strain UTEX LB 2760" /LENGTH=64 /DNA_ID=CAMNT_0027226211 /DNA_START=179 /DNA_END=373 /DNA_ORIENTATION=+